MYVRTLEKMVGRARLIDIAAREVADDLRLPPHLRVHDDWRALVEGPCDAVVIAAPDRFHPEMLRACLRAGKPCVIEKPLCLDLPTAAALHREVTESGLPVVVNHVHLFASAWQVLCRAVEEHGEPVRYVLSEGASLGPFRAETSSLWDRAPHDFSLLLELMGGEPLSVTACGVPSKHPEQFAVALDFGAGREALVHGGRLTPHRRRLLVVYTDSRVWIWNDVSEPTLTTASIAFDARNTGGLPRNVAEHVLEVPPVTPMEAMLTYFIDGLHSGPRDRFGTALALSVTRLLAACDTSLARAGGVVVGDGCA